MTQSSNATISDKLRATRARLRRSFDKRLGRLIGALLTVGPVREHVDRRLGAMSNRVIDGATDPRGSGAGDEILVRLITDPEVRRLLEAHPSIMLDAVGSERLKTEANEAFSAHGTGTTNLSGREVWLERTLAALPNGARLLDAGAGECQYRRFCGHLAYVSQDLAEYDGSGNTQGLQTGAWDTSAIDIRCDITDIPEPDASFDAVMCVEVLEHLPEPVAALRELARLLKPGGTLILTAPFCSLTHFAPYHFSTGFNRYFYEHHLKALGLEIEEIVENGNFFEYVAQEMRRTAWMAENYAGEELSAADRWTVSRAIGLLGRLSAKDRGSREMLNFGFHVRARRL